MQNITADQITRTAQVQMNAGLFGRMRFTFVCGNCKAVSTKRSMDTVELEDKGKTLAAAQCKACGKLNVFVNRAGQYLTVR